MQQNQQAQAQQQHQQVELGLDMIINKLKEAERRKLEELARQLEEVQKLIAELIQRQAGHNIDNLLLQGGGDRLGKVETAERTLLIELCRARSQDSGGCNAAARRSSAPARNRPSGTRAMWPRRPSRFPIPPLRPSSPPPPGRWSGPRFISATASLPMPMSRRRSRRLRDLVDAKKASTRRLSRHRTSSSRKAKKPSSRLT